MTQILSLLFERVDQQQILYRYQGKDFTAQNVRTNSRAFAESLRLKGIRPKDTVIFLASDSMSWIYAFWALTMIGAKIVPLLDNTDATRIKYLLSQHRIDHIVTDNTAIQAHVPVIQLHDLGHHGCPEITAYRYEPDEPYLCLSSSGTNGGFKLAVHTNKSIMACCQCLDRYSDVAAIQLGDVFWTPAKMAFALGFLVNVLGPLQNRSCSVIGAAMTEIRNFEKFVAHNAINHVLLTPYVLEFLVRHCGTDKIPTLRTLMSGAEPLSLGTAQRFQDRFGLPVWNCYGLSELMMATIDDQSLDANSVGRVLPHLEARIIDQQGNLCEPGQVGTVQLRTDAQFIGYLDDPQSTADVIRQGWVHTNDLGYFDNDKKLILLGRANSCLKIRGKWVSMVEVEHYLLDQPEITDCVMVQSENRADCVRFELYCVTAMSNQRIQDLLSAKDSPACQLEIADINIVPSIIRTQNMKKIRNVDLIRDLVAN